MTSNDANDGYAACSVTFKAKGRNFLPGQDDEALPERRGVYVPRFLTNNPLERPRSHSPVKQRMKPEPPVTRNCFPEWVAAEINRLLQARQAAGTPEEQAQYELQLAIICDAAQRYGRSLTELSEI